VESLPLQFLRSSLSRGLSRCLTVVCRIRSPCSNRSANFDVIWQVRPVTPSVRWGFFTPWRMRRFGGLICSQKHVTHSLGGSIDYWCPRFSFYWHCAPYKWLYYYNNTGAVAQPCVNGDKVSIPREWQNSTPRRSKTY